jgi:rSAM/selenodomain-associated transferase 2
MISVVIPAWNAETTLTATLSALVPAVVDGVVREVIVVDGHSEDATRAIADAAGARIVASPKGRGLQMKAGGTIARHPWLLFLHADTVLEPNWHREVEGFIERIETAGRPPKAAVFRFALSDDGNVPRIIEWGVNLRCRVFALPYGDQGLLIPLGLYNELGGYKPMPLFEDVDIVRRLGRRRIQFLCARATTSSVRFRNGGYAARVLRNWWCVLLYYCGASPERLEKIYNG